ncbi:cellulase family glycosylhydrolase [Micromonospora sp. ATCC 39149]|uniref:Cellulase family glycosylhydrolase n=1 Tax=Micromonospora carbonacea TaxID=47853 RepID=A0A7D6CG58_9ACTN|nr:cellulase family glycosylhydrolase [Micromonospora sp. ATCC 39149]QLK00716.1 cellulase family glycosylhydrolase [Micromonospora carbonacea]
MIASRALFTFLGAAGLTLALTTSAGAVVAGPRGPAATTSDGGAVSVAPHPAHGGVFRDERGREVVLRGFNVSGSTKLYENNLLPFRSRADAAVSAQAMRDLTGANTIRFLISWEGVQPAPDRIDTGYLDRAVEQIREFTDRGIYVLVDYHQDLYSAHLFHRDSWYTGDGAPAWVIQAGGYPRESCGICFLWGQNMMTNAAVRQAMADFWHNRTLRTGAGEVGVQDAFLTQATAAMRHLAQRLPAASFRNIIGFDPFNEPFDGGLEGRSGAEWERTYLLPFYQRFRAAMDTAGWAAKPAFVEPLVFWNTGFFEQGGLPESPPLGERFVFNSHYYDGARITLDPSPAGDGTYAAAMNRIRSRAGDLATAPFVSEFGNKLSGHGSDRTPWMLRAMYQGMDAGVAGARWWADPRAGGTVLSGTQWQWDIYHDRHHELMNGNPDKVQTDRDAWNDEDHSAVEMDDAGTVTLRLDRRLLDRLYPSAVAGDTLAFAYEDLARSGYGGAGQQRAWLTPPATMPAVSALVAGRQYGVLVWRQPATRPNGPTELHLPASFPAAGTAVVSDVATLHGVPTTGPVSVAREVGARSAQRLLVDTADSPTGTVHVALVVGATSGAPVTAEQLTAARSELLRWRDTMFGPAARR